MARYEKRLADKAVEFFGYLRHTKGEFFGHPFTLPSLAGGSCAMFMGRLNRTLPGNINTCISRCRRRTEKRAGGWGGALSHLCGQ